MSTSSGYGISLAEAAEVRGLEERARRPTPTGPSSASCCAQRRHGCASSAATATPSAAARLSSAAATMDRHSATDSASGFSQSTGSPAASAAVLTWRGARGDGHVDHRVRLHAGEQLGRASRPTGDVGEPVLGRAPRRGVGVQVDQADQLRRRRIRRAIVPARPGPCRRRRPGRPARASLSSTLVGWSSALWSSIGPV